LDLLGIHRLPYLTRRNYYYEFMHLLPWGLLAGAVEGQITSVVVAKTFNAGDWLVAVASATPIAALLLTLVWGMLCIGRPKLTLATLFGAGTALCAATVGLAPHTPAAGGIFVAQMALAQLFMSGFVTVRSALWKHNYPPHARGRITARLQGLRMIMSVIILAGMSLLFDHNPAHYRWLYPAVALSGLLGLLILQNIHVRHEKSELADFDADRAVGADNQPLERISVATAFSIRRVVAQLNRVLRSDRRFAWYLSAQMCFGFSVQMIIPLLVIVIREAFQMYWISTVLIVMLPKLIIFGSLRRWGWLYDRVTVPRFRVYVGLCAAGGVFFGMIGAALIESGGALDPAFVIPAAVVCFTLRAIGQGLHQGGGSLAWTLGHLDFSRRHDAELYMGVHVTLTGLRGLVAPFAGVALGNLIGWGAWAVALVLCLIGVLTYHRLAKSDENRPRTI
jgi:MFS family permease